MPFIHTINPLLFKLGPFEIRYYGIIFVLGFLLAYYLIPKLAKERSIPVDKNATADLLVWLMAGVVLGARIFYVLVYNLQYYLQNPVEIIAIWHGGLSFHGGLLGAIIAGWYFAKRHNIPFLALADLVVVPTALGLMLGRIANFLNGELYGRITDLPWGVKFPDAEGYRHPSQLYESAKNLVIFTVLWSFRKKKLPHGFLFGMFICLYSFLRFFIEFFREPDAQLGFFFGWMTMGQILNSLLFIGGTIFLWTLQKRQGQ